MGRPGDIGQRCEARRFLEYDHVQEVAKGGRASVSGIRLRCRAHSRFTAERTFGVEFMRARREAARPGDAQTGPNAHPG